jgi:hypothetical protein
MPGQRVDLEHVLVLALGHEEIDAGEAPGAAAERLAPRSARLSTPCSGWAPGARAGSSRSAPSGTCSCSRRTRRFGTISIAPSARPSRMPTVTSRPIDEALDEDRGRRSFAASSIAARARPCSSRDHADARAPRDAASRRPGSRSSRASPRACRARPLDDVVRRGRHVVEPEQLLGLELVHRERAREHARARVGDAQSSRGGPGRSRPRRTCRGARGTRRRSTSPGQAISTSRQVMLSLPPRLFASLMNCSTAWSPPIAATAAISSSCR